MYEIRKDHRKVNGQTVTTYRREVSNANILEVEAGTNGLHGGDTGHGCRTYIRVEDLGGTDITVLPLREGGVVVHLGGDAELITMIRALEFITEVLKDQMEELPHEPDWMKE